MKRWSYTSFAQKGLSHAQAGLECQDRVIIKESRNGIAAVLCDGLGSLPYSQFAAQAAVEAAAEWLLIYVSQGITLPREEKVKNTFQSDLISYTVNRVTQSAERHGISIEKMDCTFSFVLISHLTNEILLGRLGDSAVCVITKEKSVSYHAKSDLINATQALLDKDAADNLEIIQMDQSDSAILGFILTSDGLEGEIYVKGGNEVNKNAELYFNALLEENPEEVIEEQVGELLAGKETTFDDDISVAIISRAATEVELEDDPTWLCRCGKRNALLETICPYCSTDFMSLYSQVKFSDYGGKRNFFRAINQMPKAEKSLLKGYDPKELFRSRKGEKDRKNDSIKKKTVGTKVFWFFCSLLVGLLGIQAVVVLIMLFI